MVLYLQIHIITECTRALVCISRRQDRRRKMEWCLNLISKIQISSTQISKWMSTYRHLLNSNSKLIPLSPHLLLLHSKSWTIMMIIWMTQLLSTIRSQWTWRVRASIWMKAITWQSQLRQIKLIKFRELRWAAARKIRVDLKSDFTRNFWIVQIKRLTLLLLRTAVFRTLLLRAIRSLIWRGNSKKSIINNKYQVLTSIIRLNPKIIPETIQSSRPPKVQIFSITSCLSRVIAVQEWCKVLWAFQPQMMIKTWLVPLLKRPTMQSSSIQLPTIRDIICFLIAVVLIPIPNFTISWRVVIKVISQWSV